MITKLKENPTEMGASEKQRQAVENFKLRMDREIEANSFKGDFDAYTKDDALLEIDYHLAKLRRAVRRNDPVAIEEHSADVANCSAILAFKYGLLNQPNEKPGNQTVARASLFNDAKCETNGYYGKPESPSRFGKKLIVLKETLRSLIWM